MGPELVAERRPNLAHAVVHAVLKVDVRLIAPDSAPDLFVRDDVTGTAGEQGENRGGLWLQASDRAVTAQLAARHVELTAADEPV